jgi:hypothetical protein
LSTWMSVVPYELHTQEIYRYWIIFVDDAHRFWVVILLWKENRLFRLSCTSRPLLSSSLDVMLALFAIIRVKSMYLVSGVIYIMWQVPICVVMAL